MRQILRKSGQFFRENSTFLHKEDVLCEVRTAAGQSIIPLTEKDICPIRENRVTSCAPDYWTKHIADETHYGIVMQVESPSNYRFYRLLYDSWLWRGVLEKSTQLKRNAVVLELLPGSSETIPLALESAQFCGDLYRLNDELPVALPRTFHFGDQWINGRLLDLVSGPQLYDAILANHIIDDLLFSLYCPDLKKRRRTYFDYRWSKETWASIARSGYLPEYQNEIASLFVNLVHKMVSPSTLILRHYPSTIALVSEDLLRINSEMSTYFAVTNALSACEQCRAFFLDISSIEAPPGSKYPESFFVLRKGAV